MWQKRFPTIIFAVEILVWLLIGYFGRIYFDQLTVHLNPAWLVLLLKVALLAIIIALAVLGHNKLEQYLRARGIIE